MSLALGNLMGSNPFNVTILAVDDLLYRRGSLLSDATRCTPAGPWRW